MRNARRTVAALTLIALISCNAPAPWREAAPPAYHVVVCWLKSPGDPVARQRLIDESMAFRTSIPGLVRVAAGTALPSTRPTVDTSFDVAIVMTFESEAALRAYEKHPAHRAAVERTLKPLVERFIVYDFQE